MSFSWSRRRKSSRGTSAEGYDEVADPLGDSVHLNRTDVAWIPTKDNSSENQDYPLYSIGVKKTVDVV